MTVAVLVSNPDYSQYPHYLNFFLQFLSMSAKVWLRLGALRILAKGLQLKISQLANTGIYYLINVCCPYKQIHLKKKENIKGWITTGCKLLIAILAIDVVIKNLFLFQKICLSFFFNKRY